MLLVVWVKVHPKDRLIERLFGMPIDLYCLWLSSIVVDVKIENVDLKKIQNEFLQRFR